MSNFIPRTRGPETIAKIVRPEVRGNQMMIDKVYIAGAQRPESLRPPSKAEQRDKRQAAQAKRMRKAAKRAQP